LTDNRAQICLPESDVNAIAEAPAKEVPRERSSLAARIRSLPAPEAAALIERTPPAEAVQALQEINPGMAACILRQLESAPRRFLAASAPPQLAEQWKRNTRYPHGTIGEMMEPPISVFEAAMTVGAAIDELRPLVQATLVTYVYVVDAASHLVGLVTMRDLLFNDRAQTLGEVMLREPFTLSPELKVQDAMKLTVNRHFPQYPVCDAEGKLVGVVRGAALFELEAFEITAQAGSMVGVEKEERISTPIGQSFRFRTPWLLGNLVTAFAAGGVVAYYQGTLDRLVILATFVPVLMGQCANTGCQSLAVTVRGITLGEIGTGAGRQLVTKEMLLGFANGAMAGVLCGLAMYFYALAEGSPHALKLALVVNAAMIASSALSGVSGALVPLALKRLGADPATASSIVVTTATDVSSVGLLLALATYLVK
jgi:magnesium transporter